MRTVISHKDELKFVEYSGMPSIEFKDKNKNDKISICGDPYGLELERTEQFELGHYEVRFDIYSSDIIERLCGSYDKEFLMEIEINDFCVTFFR